MMTAIKVNFEIGHEASLKTKKTPEGFTHDWEVFVRGPEGADISHFVDKVVFHLHETFPKPKRVVKEPPFSIKESGYAGFTFPIEIYLKNRDEPKKIMFTYDLSFNRQIGVLRDRYVFNNPNDDFKKKLLKGGGLIVNTNNTFYTNPDQENRSRDSFTEEKPVTVKAKSSSEPFKKHKTKEPKEEPSYFENLFGAPIHKTAKVSPDPKKLEKTAAIVKSDKKEKDRSSSDKKSKHEHKEPKPDKNKSKEDKDKVKPDKVKSSKDAEKVKEKSNKRPSERPPSPEPAKKKVPSPTRRPPSPPRLAPGSKEEYKIRPNIESLDVKKSIKPDEKPVEHKPDKEGKEKKKKDKKSHDRDKERREKKEHKKENQKVKESPKEQVKEGPKETPKPKELFKEKDPVKGSPVQEKPPKPDKAINKFSIENLKKTPQHITERIDEHKTKSTDQDRKHKHKKKDKKRDESREKHKESSKENKKHKSDKVRDVPVEKQEIEKKDTAIPRERPPPEPVSPISIDTASQCSSKSGIVKPTQHDTEDINSSPSDSEESVIAEEEEPKVKTNPTPEPPKEQTPEPEPIPEPVVEPPPHKEKSKKHKDKSSKREEKKRKRKADEEENENRKVPKLEQTTTDKTDELGESSGIVSTETKLQDNGVSSSLGEDADPGDLSPDYMVQLRGLQQRIMTIKSNEELERVVNLIAETGRYEVTTQTFDFDLCLLDRSTVQQLIQLVGC